MQKTKNIFLTGATGTMGFEGLKRLLNDTNYKITLLVKKDKKNVKKLKPFKNNDRVRIIWGDLREYEKVLECVTGADYVLHVGGMVSPRADKYPEETMDVNINSIENIVEAIKNQPDPDKIKLVYIGSVAQIGHRDAPNHFGSPKDVMNPAQFDHYAVSKIMAERVVAESGLKYWVSLRQSGILYPDLVKKGINPITFHVPLEGVLEWATVEDSGNLLVKICDDNVPDEFWKNFYDISSGRAYRLTNYEFECELMEAIHCPPPEKIFETNWFALSNFHGCWYMDADRLEDYLHFRLNTPRDEYFKHIQKSVPWYFKLVKIVPAGVIKWFMKRIAHSKGTGTMDWIKNNNEEKISAYFGSKENWENIPSWDKLNKTRPTEVCPNINYGECFSKPQNEWDINDMRLAAQLRGGKCLSEDMIKGDLDTKLVWENSSHEQFYASPRYVLFGGYFPDHRLIEEDKKFYRE
ncbi:MAG: NAD(P)-dependent oxidoreductase [Bacteroidales bacterium]|jgi:nucleoside-diphosphate-sugar epimerase|nr:NAD(P)-dependent oxidoreductase [Bacteroidales bacterium]